MKTFKTRSKIYDIVFAIANLFFINAALGQITSIKDKADLTQSETSASVEEFKEGKYLVRIITVGSHGYGYEILESNELIVRQYSRPYFLIPTPFIKIENVKIVAKWHILQIKQYGERRLAMNIERAELLGLSKEDLTVSTNNKQ